MAVAWAMSSACFRRYRVRSILHQERHGGLGRQDVQIETFHTALAQGLAGELAIAAQVASGGADEDAVSRHGATGASRLYFDTPR